MTIKLYIKDLLNHNSRPPQLFHPLDPASKRWGAERQWVILCENGLDYMQAPAIDAVHCLADFIGLKFDQNQRVPAQFAFEREVLREMTTRTFAQRTRK